MLTSDLLRVSVRKGVVRAQYLETDAEEALERAGRLVQIFRDHVGSPRAPIDEAVEEAVGHGTDYLIWRGLAKLLYDRCEFECVAPVEPTEVRRLVFGEAASGMRPGDEGRRAVIEEVGARLGMSAKQVEEALYADLDERLILVNYEDVEPVALLERYNVALAQAILYRAVELEIEVGEEDPNVLRYLFGVLKFNRLMHRTERVDGAYRLSIDGPASLFKRSRKYGIRMARFLPALLLLKDWTMRAELEWEGASAQFNLTSREGLRSHYKARGQWIAREEKYFEERFDDFDTDWTLRREGRIVELPENQVLVSDYVLEDSDGNEVLVEIVGFWRLGYLERRIELLERAERAMVLVVSERLKAGREELSRMPSSVVFFKGVILCKKVVAAAEEVRRLG